MRPLNLTLQGFTAFRQHTELDFSDLELFALVGPTGSGKSSLLDAITYALYGQTARLGASGLDALISQGERALAVSLTFEAGGITYRASRTKGRKQAENEVRFERLDDDGLWTNLSEGGAKGISERIRQVLGLDFANFRRSVILPQGEFSRLLHGSGKDRQALLGELTGLDHIAAMQKVASDRSKELKVTSQQLISRLEGEYASISAEWLADLRTQREQTDTQAEQLQQTREALLAEQTRLRDREKIWQAREDTRRKLSMQESRAASVQQGAERAARARRVAGVLPLLDSAERSRLASERDAREAAQAQATAQAARTAAEAAAASLQAAQNAETHIPELEARAEALRDAEAEAARLKRAGGTPQSTHPQPLDWDEDAFDAAREGAQKAEKLRLERVQLEAAKQALSAAAQRLQTEQAAFERDTNEQSRVQRDGENFKAQLEAAQKTLEEARLNAGLASYRAHLHVGDECPLCLQVVQKLPQAEVTTLDSLQSEVNTLSATLEERRARFTELRASLKSQAREIERLKAEQSDWEAQLSQREQDIRQLESHIQGDPADTLARLLAGLAGRVRAAGADAAGNRRKVLAEIQAVRKGLQDAQAAHARAGGDLAAAEATARAASSVAAQRGQEHAEAQAALSAALTTLSLTAEQARAAALPEADILAFEQAARDSQAQIAALRETLADLERQLGSTPFDPAALTQLARDLTATDAALTSAREQAGRLAEQERNGRERLQLKAELEAQAAETARQYDLWQTLTNSLKTNEFQQFLLAEVEAQLLTRAGVLLFDISDGRYRLALQDGDYVVQDLWNAGEVRGVKTLSGGETFLASLALAIALSDYLAGNKILGALFLDEGFGTLDPQALEAVAGALENLRTQGRMVGVVTHVESLSERLPSRLLVTKSVAGSSVQRLDG